MNRIGTQLIAKERRVREILSFWGWVIIISSVGMPAALFGVAEDYLVLCAVFVFGIFLGVVLLVLRDMLVAIQNIDVAIRMLARNAAPTSYTSLVKAGWIVPYNEEVD